MHSRTLAGPHPELLGPQPSDWPILLLLVLLVALFIAVDRIVRRLTKRRRPRVAVARFYTPPWWSRCTEQPREPYEGTGKPQVAK